MNQDLLQQLYTTIQDRKTADPEKSYVAKMFSRGSAKIAQKVGEEAVELVIDSIRLSEKPDSPKRREGLVNEAADLVFHLLLLLAEHDVNPDEILQVLENRMGTGGLQEKAARTGLKS